MNTSFKILWFEDELSWYNMEKLRIQNLLKKHCLTPDFTRKDGDDFQISELTGNEYDLILMDYKLADGVTGETIVSAIRQSEVLTDILFYSSEEDTMLSAIYKSMPPIDGVYLTKRDYTLFTEKAEKLIEKIVRRSEDVVNLRGFVLDNTSDFEVRIKEMLNICWQKFTDEQRYVLTDAMLKQLNAKQENDSERINSVKSSECVFACANSNIYLLGISDRLTILNKILSVLYENYDLEKHFAIKNFREYYYDRIGTYRNKLGHISFADKFITINGREIELDQDFHRLMRKNISEVDNKIKELESFVTEYI